MYPKSTCLETVALHEAARATYSSAVAFSEFALRTVLLFLPGVVSFLVIDKLTAHRPFKPYAAAMYSFLLGFYCYVVSAVLLDVLRPSGPRTKVAFIEALSDARSKLDLFEIITVSALAVPGGFLVAFVINRHWVHRLAHALRVSRKLGDFDVWSYVMNSDVPWWVVIRDREHDVMYDGWIAAVPLYLPRRRDAITVEFAAVDYTQIRGGGHHA